MYAIFNELSVSSSETFDKEYSRSTINDFVKLLHKVNRKIGFKSLITTSDFYNLNVSAYNINDWLNDPLVERNHKTFLRTFYNKCTSIDHENYSSNDFEIGINDKIVNGIGCLVASELNESVISLKTDTIWLKDVIKGTLLTYENDEIINEEREIDNISEEAHINSVEAKLIHSEFAMLSSGQDLWEKREKLFPNLIFCRSIKDQLYKDPERFHIEQVAKKLLGLQQYFSNYNGIYNPNELGFKARTESETVKSNDHLKGLRLFEKPDGTREYFYDHIGFTGKYCGRIHFFPDNVNKKCYIGYIGVHLQTKKF
ncbi:hypothetical protein KZO01_20390 [Kurthia zopfii]|uniref:Uncharacterized protein n=1 Tax=Kurthia zopfii TaxID=1650 RepID=A0A8B4QDQ6_9BACL|nr:hypothetical protein [Kurthia zopfii]PWI22437.1 hypothetical protein DF281_06940 [Kurthia zopfii]TDR38838.1 hypothetical protein DFR61_11459 [Kurthia zopfii]GEK31730.1 hypothetical protein KZO01_20390 [Kurthia zopfii]STX10744.1 Uncharacterised protein [Kurthia zopfii]